MQAGNAAGKSGVAPCVQAGRFVGSGMTPVAPWQAICANLVHCGQSGGA